MLSIAAGFLQNGENVLNCLLGQTACTVTAAMDKLFVDELFHHFSGQLISVVGSNLGGDVVLRDIVVFDVSGFLDAKPYVFQPAVEEGGKEWVEQD